MRFLDHGKPEALHCPGAERRRMEAWVRAGGRDGIRATPTLSNEEVSVEGNQGVEQLRNEIAPVKTAPFRPYRK